MKTPITLKELFWVIIIIVFTSFFLSISVQSIIAFAKTGADWVSALLALIGGIIGGLIGGIVAFLAAKYQVHGANLQEKNRQAKSNLTVLKLIREELHDNISVLENAVPYTSENYRVLKSQLSDDTWKSTLLLLNIRDELLIHLNISYKKISLIKSLNEDELKDDILTNANEVITKTLDMVKTEIDNQLI